MIAFVTSLRHPQNSASYAKIEDLLQATLRSVAQQSSDDFVIIVVGNQHPEFELPRNTLFIPVAFDAPAPPTGPRTARAPFVRDKGTKIGIGLIAARDFNPDYVMIFDADDFVHRDLAEFTARHPGQPGWVIADGWVYSHSRNGYRRQLQFHRTCGTSFIIPYEAYAVPEHLTVDATQEDLLSGFGDVLPNIIGAHRDAFEWHRSRGRELLSFPYRAAVYHVDTGENHSGKVLPGVIRPMNKRFASTFAIEPTQSLVRTTWSALGPKALVQSGISLARSAARASYRAVRRLIPGTGDSAQ